MRITRIAALVALAARAAFPAEAPPPDLAAVGVVLGARPDRSVAILEAAGRTRTAGVGDAVFGGRVVAVGREQVSLDFDGRRVDLALTSGTVTAAAPPRRDPAARPSAGPPPGEAMGFRADGAAVRKQLARADVERRLEQEMPRLIGAALRPVSEDGRVIGMRVSRLPGGTLLEEVGLRSGDVVTSINGAAVDGLPALLGLWSSLRTAPELDATVLRDGATVALGVSVR